MPGIFHFLLNLLPRLFEGYDRVCGWIAPDGFHKPGCYGSTLFLGPAGLHLWRCPIEARWKRWPVRLLGLTLLLLGLKVFLKGCFIFAGLLVLGRPFRWLFRKLGFDESRDPPPVPSALTFVLTRCDRVALGFIAVILLIFFINRDQLMPRDDSDHQYHMAVARMILDQGRVPAWDDWEYAPAGRPHLYPPVVHLLIALFAGRPDQIATGFETLQVIVYPLAIFLTWWFARWWFGDRHGLLTALVFSMDMAAGWTMVAVLPSALVTALIPLIFMSFLTRRRKATIALLTLAFYTHMGIPTMIVLGLFLFAVRHREYYGFFKHVLAWTAVLYVPWFLRLLPHLDWLGTPTTAIYAAGGHRLGAFLVGAVLGFLMLQMINPLFVMMGLVGIRRMDHPGARFLKHILMGFLPLLIAYGGRFWMHIAPFWAIWVAYLFTPILPEDPSRRRLATILLCTLIPLPLVAIGAPSGKMFRMLPSISVADFALAYALTPAKPDPDFEQLAGFIRRETSAREIVHVDPSKNYLGDRIVAVTGRRVDVGGWGPEVRNQKMVVTLEAYRKIDTHCLFVYENQKPPDDLRLDRIETIGRFQIGIRGKAGPLAEQVHPPEK